MPSKIKLVAILDTGFTIAPSFVINRHHKSLKIKKIPALAFLLHHDDLGYIMVDTGYSKEFLTATQSFPARFYRWVTPVKMREKQSVIAQLKEHGIEPTDIKIIILSHLHADHVGDLRAFSQSQILIEPAELDYAQKLKGTTQVRHGYLKYLLEPVTKRGEAIQVAAPTGLFGPDSLELVELSGHSRAMFGLKFQDKQSQQEILLAADAAWSQAEVQDPDNGPAKLAHMMMYSWPLYQKSIQKVHDYHQQGVKVLLAHESRESQWF